MNYSMDGKLNRRQAIGGSAILGLGLILAGCQAGKARWKPLTQEDLDGPPRHPLGPMRERPQPVITPAPVGVIARREWTSTAPTLALANPMGPITRITIHHDGMPPVSLRSKSDTAARLEFIRRAHANNRGWADIGYHFAIDPQGRVWECRPTRFQGAHVKDNNENNLGIVVLGNFDEQAPTSAALTALDTFVADRMRAHRIPVSRVLTHQEITPTACPGRSLQGYMVATRSNRGNLASF